MYPFRKVDNDYFFESEQGLQYEIYFVAAPFYFPENYSFKHSVFEFIIKPADNQKYLRPGRDSEIPLTIAAIFLDFFTSHEKVVVFSCDTTDGKQAARHRKFNDWYLRFNDTSFLKYDGIIQDPINDTTYFMSLIIKSNNPFIHSIEAAFRELTDDLTGAK